MSQLDYVPQDLWPMMISFMDDKTKRQIRATNKKWLNYIKYNNFALYYMTKEDLPTVVEYLSRYSWPIELSFQKHRFTDMKDIINQLCKLTNLAKLHRSPYLESVNPTSEDSWMRLTTLTNLEYWSVHNNFMPLKLLQYFTKLTNWNFRASSEEEIIPVLNRMANLNSLTYRQKALPLVHLNWASKLTYLSVFMYPDMAQYSQHWSLLTNLKELKTHYGTNVDANLIEISHLTALERCFLDGFYSAPSFALLTNLTHLEIPTHRWTLESALSLKKLKKLKYLSIHHDVDQFNILADLDQLQTLSLANRATVNSSIASLTRLTNLESLLLLICHPKDFSCLTQLTNLTSLIINNPVEEVESCIGRFTLLKHLEIMNPRRGELTADFSDLTNLTSLRLALIKNCPNELQYLTHLIRLDIAFLGTTFTVCYDFLSNLRGLTGLFIYGTSANYYESFWSNLPLLTNIQELNINMDHDDRLLQLVSIKKLTSLTYGSSSSRDLTGVHLTALTSLQRIIMQKTHVKRAYARFELFQHLPHLFFYND